MKTENEMDKELDYFFGEEIVNSSIDEQNKYKEFNNECEHETEESHYKKPSLHNVSSNDYKFFSIKYRDVIYFIKNINSNVLKNIVTYIFEDTNEKSIKQYYFLKNNLTDSMNGILYNKDGYDNSLTTNVAKTKKFINILLSYIMKKDKCIMNLLNGNNDFIKIYKVYGLNKKENKDFTYDDMYKILENKKIVYRIINDDDNDTIYIGITQRTLEERFNEHIKEKMFLRITNCHIEELEIVNDCDARKIEQHYITKYNTLKKLNKINSIK